MLLIWIYSLEPSWLASTDVKLVFFYAPLSKKATGEQTILLSLLLFVGTFFLLGVFACVGAYEEFQRLIIIQGRYHGKICSRDYYFYVFIAPHTTSLRGHWSPYIAF